MTRTSVRISICLALASLIPAAMAQRASTRTAHKAHAAAAGTVFGAAQTNTAGFGGATQPVAGDFNGDGVPDLAVVNPCSSSYCGSGYGSVTILIGNGDGSFQDPVPYATGTYQPMSVATGDFNGDGVPDLVVASQCASSASCGSGQVSVFLGNGDGTFQSPVSYASGSGSSYFVAVADFNNDGYLDLAVANQTSAGSTVSILLGNGDGTFQQPAGFATGAASAQFMAVADFNSDGALDLAVANGGTQDSVSILLGNGDGTFQAPGVYASGGSSAATIAVGDFNGDGAPDLAVANGCANYNNLVCSSSGAVGVLLGNGDGTFQPAASYGSGGNQANWVTVADFDGDGQLDLAVSNLGSTSGGSNAGVLSLLAGNGDGTFQPASTYGTGGNYGASVTTKDFNGDGQPDLAVVNQCGSAQNCPYAIAGILLNTVTNFQLYASTTTLSVSPNPAGANQAVLLTATVTASPNAGAATGNVTFYAGGTALSTVAVSSGQAAYTASFATPGAQAVQAVYFGDASHASSTSAATSVMVGTPVTLTSSLNPAAFNQTVIFTAAVDGSGATPTGSVTFNDGNALLGTFPLVNGSAAVSMSSLGTGTHSITASYSGDTTYQPGYATLVQAVSQGSTTALSSSANPATVNQPVTYTATVTGQYGGVPGGAVAFMQGTPATTWGTAPLVNGQATISTAFSTQGSDPITAVYLGSSTYQTSTSAVLTETVNGTQNVTTTTALVSSAHPSNFNQPVVFTATVTPASGAIPDGEIVTFYNGANTLGTGATTGGMATLTTSALPVGTNAITATYSGDSTYQSSTSHVVKQTVHLDPTTTTLTSSLNPSTYGQSVIFQVTVAPQSGSGTPTGTVTLTNGGTAIGSIPLTNGAGSFSTSTLPAGPLSIAAAYGGDINFASSTATLTQAVGVATTTTALTASPNPASVNQTVTFTATVTGQYGASLTGTVKFTRSGRNLGTGTLVLGQASVTASFSANGTYPVVATYSGDVNDLASTSPALDEVVGTTPTTTTLTSSGSPSYVGQTVTFTATVTPTAGAIPNHETVTFYDGSATLGTGLTLNGVATFATSSLAAGSYSITATYAGDANYESSTSRVLIQIVDKNASATTLKSNVNPSVYGQSVTLTATVAPASSSSLVPTGKVTFKNGSAALASVTLSNGVASYTTTRLPAGSLSLVAAYEGDSNFATSSGTLTEQVNQSGTTTTLTSNPNPSSLGQSVTFKATVTGQYQGLIGGSVTFMNGTNSLGNVVLSNGRATLAFTFTAPGTDSITAVYAGDANDQASTSPVLDQAVTNAVTTTTLSSSGTPVFVTQPVTFTATVTSSYGAIPNGELVTFYDSGTEIGTGETMSGAASMTISTLTVGTHTITATYAGDATFASSTSKKFTQTISQQTTTTVVTSSSDPSTYGLAVTFTANVTGSEPTPTGTVKFKNGTALLGTATLGPHGGATLTTLTLDAGSYAITVAYSGDTDSAKSTSAPLTQVVNQATSTTQIYSSVNPAALGESIAFTAVVRSATTVATGTVTFSVGGQTLGTATLVNGSAKLAVTTLPPGTSNVTATYAGSADVAGSSATIAQVVE